MLYLFFCILLLCSCSFFVRPKFIVHLASPSSLRSVLLPLQKFFCSFFVRPKKEPKNRNPEGVELTNEVSNGRQDANFPLLHAGSSLKSHTSGIYIRSALLRLPSLRACAPLQTPVHTVFGFALALRKLQVNDHIYSFLLKLLLSFFLTASEHFGIKRLF